MKLLQPIYKKRTLLHLLFPLFCLLFAVPTKTGLWIGAGLVILGECIRLFSAGYILKNEFLTTGGPYAYTRNPLYLGSFIIGLGVCFLSGLNYVVFLVYLFLFVLVYIPTIKTEEEFLAQKFGEAYISYKSTVPSFFPLPNRKFINPTGTFSWARVKENKELRSLLFSLLLIILYILKYFLGKYGFL